MMSHCVIFNTEKIIKANHQNVRVVILVINIVITQIVIPIQSWPSGAGFYACELDKICNMVICKNITILVA